MQIDALLIVDKPEGMTSLDVVREIKHRFAVKKAGHIGTLDPFATGVLPIAMNEGTKLVPFIDEEPKEYEAVLKLGEETTTDDWTGRIVLKKPWEGITPPMIHDAFQPFLGKIQQIPPMFSAVKVQGQPLYRFARKGIEIERKYREVEIFNFQINTIDLPLVGFRVSCSKGTYIRTLGKEIGRKIGCGAHLFRLRRIRSGPFNLEKAIPWERLKEISEAKGLSPWLIPLEEALPGLPEMIGDEELVKKIRVGKRVVVGDFPHHWLHGFEEGQWFKMSTPEEGLVAILRSEMKGKQREGMSPEVVALRPLRVFQTKKREDRENTLIS